MSEKTPNNHDTRGSDALRDLLRTADPAGVIDPAGLDPIERANLRRHITAAAEEDLAANTWRPSWSAGRPAWLLPAMAAALLVAAVGLAVWSLQGGAGSTAGTVAEGVAPAPRASVPTEPAATAPAGETPPTTARATSTQEAPLSETPRQAVADAAVDVPGISEPPPGAGNPTIDQPAAEPAAVTVADRPAVADTTTPDTDRQARTVQFVAPRGTRIIWTLDPNFESPIAGQEPRQEEAP
jgi:hypothetical protein